MRTMTAKAAQSAKAQAGSGTSGSPATGPAGRRGGKKASMGVQNVAGWLFSTPFLVLFLVFMAFPIIATLVMSFTDFGLRNVTHPLDANFIGFENYIKLFSDEKFLKSLFNT